MSTRTFLIYTLMTLSLLTYMVGVVQAGNNTIFGTGAGASLTPAAHGNTLLGENAGKALENNPSNTLVGHWAGQNITNSFNTMVGDSAGRETTVGSRNAFFGISAGLLNTTGTRNTYLGANAGYQNQTGSFNVFLGFFAGSQELGSDKLYIDSSATAAPLIYGDFANDWVGVNGRLGVGTQIPLDQLHIRDGNLRIEQTGATNAALFIYSNGKGWVIKNNQATGRLTFWSPGGGATTASFKFDRQAVENLLRVGVLAGNTVDINGNLVVTGTITPDYVFTPEYKLETIEAHAAYMWEHKHLPAVGPGQVNAQGQGMVNVGQRSQGMLEELEKAHIYIEQLHGEITQNEAELAALKSQMTEKETQLEQAHHDIGQLQGEMATLKALVHQMVSQPRSAVPGKES